MKLVFNSKNNEYSLIISVTISDHRSKNYHQHSTIQSSKNNFKVQAGVHYFQDLLIILHFSYVISFFHDKFY